MGGKKISLTLRTPFFRITFLRWLNTVYSLMPKCSAIWVVRIPRAIYFTISFSRLVRRCPNTGVNEPMSVFLHHKIWDKLMRMVWENSRFRSVFYPYSKLCLAFYKKQKAPLFLFGAAGLSVLFVVLFFYKLYRFGMFASSYF